MKHSRRQDNRQKEWNRIMDNRRILQSLVKLPDSVMNNISEKTADLAGEALDASGIYAQVSVGMADFILNGISFLLHLLLG